MPSPSPRNILCVFPRYSPSFGTFHHAYPLMKGVHGFMPPQGLLTIAAYLPDHWRVRLVDENVKPACENDYEWADAVFVSGMHIQRRQINRINEIAHRYQKTTVLGGPSVSACAEYYPDFDILHLGELGDATEQLIDYLGGHEKRPPGQVQLLTERRLPLEEFPIPAYHRIELNNYFIGSIQFSSGCPYRCEFCDIPELYGRTPRLKRPEQILTELDAMLESGNPGAIYFVDDNFVANRRAAEELVGYLIDWQKQRGYPVEFACEATLNIAKQTQLLKLMREAYFCTIFCGIETPEVPALKAMSKAQNLAVPLLDSVRRINEHGMEVVSGIIMGLDTDTRETELNILDFIRQSHIPMLTINLLHALPKTPLWRRLEQAGRLVFDEHQESNVIFRMPYERVLGMWRNCVREAYAPEFLYERFLHNRKNTYARRIHVPLKTALTMRNIKKASNMLLSILRRIGFQGTYRKAFWKMAWQTLKAADIQSFFHISLVAHHLIEFARQCEYGKEAACFYAQNSFKEAA